MSINVIAILVTACVLSTVEAAPLSLQDQLQVALKQISELTGNGTLDSCCNVSLVYRFKALSPRVQISYCIGGNFCQEKITANFATSSQRRNFLSCVNDYIQCR